jgi:hypothetical protein
MMLGPVVVGYDVIEPIMSKGAIGRGCFQMASRISAPYKLSCQL